MFETMIMMEHDKRAPHNLFRDQKNHSVQRKDAPLALVREAEGGSERTEGIARGSEWGLFL